jgi:hypothetical protein
LTRSVNTKNAELREKNYANLTSSELRKTASELSVLTFISLTVTRNEAHKFPCEKWATFTIHRLYWETVGFIYLITTGTHFKRTESSGVASNCPK